MPLTDQEARCVNLANRHFSMLYGGVWNIESCPDDTYTSEPSPEVIVTNGDSTAAIEVKRLTGDSIYQAYKESLLSNQKLLTPSCGGSYNLVPTSDFRHPIPVNLRGKVKQEIERVAPSLGPGQSGVIRLPRQGRISLISESGPPYVMCSHGRPLLYELLRPLPEKISGGFMLVDEGLEHSFFTAEGRNAFRNAFYEAVVDAYERLLSGDAIPFTWYEEWELTRHEDDPENEDDKDGVWIMSVTPARDMKSSVAECVYAVLENALRKFATRRWADHQVLVLDAFIPAPERLVTKVLAGLEPDDLPGVDLILLVDGDKIVQCYPAARPRMG
jgi:hypothetical protein